MMYDRYDYLSREQTSNLQRDMRGAGMKRYHGNSFINQNGDDVELYSYKTFIASWNKGNGILWVNGGAFDYSATTCRHISKFLQDYTDLDYYEVKGWITFADKYGDFQMIKGIKVVVM